jgi:uncharacterized membrane protein
MKRLLTPSAAHRLSVGLIAAIFCVAGVLHFLLAPRYVAIMPRWLPHPLPLVQVSGVCEVLGGLGYLLPATRRWAAIGLAALLVAVFPANLQMLANAVHAHAPAWQVALLVLRLPLQPLLIFWVWRNRGSTPAADSGRLDTARREASPD